MIDLLNIWVIEKEGWCQRSKHQIPVYLLDM